MSNNPTMNNGEVFQRLSQPEFIIGQFYYEIHLKYCQDKINRQYISKMENIFFGKKRASYSGSLNPNLSKG